jgi:V8-like Glu-specific endopeptidase
MPAGNATAYAKWTALMPVYRFYNLRNGVHFYTASEAEKNNVLATLSSTYRLEGVAYYVNTTTSTNGDPLYRFYNAKKGVHFYTASEAEKNRVLATLSSTYRLEGVAYYVSHNPSGAPVYRFYNFKKGVHFYTASEAEKNNVLATLSSTYRLEGVGFYLAP